jgi:hypothetical protein
VYSAFAIMQTIGAFGVLVPLIYLLILTSVN